MKTLQTTLILVFLVVVTIELSAQAVYQWRGLNRDGKLTASGSFKIDKGAKEHFAHPVLANGVLYIRHGNVMMAYKVK